MLRPTKHSTPELTVLPVAGQLLGHLRKHRTATVAGLRTLVRESRREREPLFVPAVELLFLLGLIEYRRKSDSLEYVGP